MSLLPSTLLHRETTTGQPLFHRGRSFASPWRIKGNDAALSTVNRQDVIITTATGFFFMRNNAFIHGRTQS
jgi:hypothetical protein